MTLHTVNLLPDHADCQRCIEQLEHGDVVVFLGRSAWIANADARWHKDWVREGVDLCVLADDLAAAGLADKRAAAITPVDYAAFVALSEAHPRQRAWF